MIKLDFITLANIIFKDKNKYKFVSDEEKIDNFFILNRKFAFNDIKKAQFFNFKNVNKASAMDIWYSIFYKTTNGTPQWWWKSKQNSTKVKSDFNTKELDLIKEHYNIKDSDIDFLIKYYKENLKDDIKRLKRFSNKEKTE